jgi:hypothetical protein
MCCYGHEESPFISYCIVSHAVTEKEALILVSRHPFFTKFFLPLPDGGNFEIFKPASYLERVLYTEFYHQCENVVIFLNICGLLY